MYKIIQFCKCFNLIITISQDQHLDLMQVRCERGQGPEKYTMVFPMIEMEEQTHPFDYSDYIITKIAREMNLDRMVFERFLNIPEEEPTIRSYKPGDCFIGVDLSQKPDHSPRVEDYLERADVSWGVDAFSFNKRIVTSKNVEAPLTVDEQDMIKRMWINQGFKGEVEFRVGGKNNESNN